ncbi:unnamed protein product [Lactuca virosa]|uniref:SMP-LTD domain-containing protein n=1 Tax=Lactuca virosa TaxID=75947 RepID=A0AAU9MYJ5_9ASTR|nr:unnamed protein product [Lactuca virosa]
MKRRLVDEKEDTWPDGARQVETEAPMGVLAVVLDRRRRTKLRWFTKRQAASELIKANLEPTLEQYRPMVLSSLSFSKFTLGTVAPQFIGVSTVEDGGEGITMELEMNWDGNPSIILDIKTRLGVGLPVQVKNIAFIRVSRLIFKQIIR